MGAHDCREAERQKVERAQWHSVETGKEFDTLIANLDSSMNCTGLGSKPRPLLAKPKKEQIGNDKVKVDWMNEVEKLQSGLDRNHKSFLQLRTRAVP